MKLASALRVLTILTFVAVSTARADRLTDARKLIKRDMFFSAEKKLEALVEKDKDNHKAYALLAECRLKLKDADGARSAAARALDIVEDENADYWKLLGRADFALGEAAFLAKASSNEIKGRYADAGVRFKQALELNPDDPEVRWRIGQALEWQEYPKKARTFYEEQLEKFPKVPESYLRMGALIAGEASRIGDGRTEAAKAVRAEAMKLYREGLDKAGPHGELYYYLGIAHEWNSEWVEARDCYLQAIRADSECHKAWSRLNEKYRGDGGKEYQITNAELLAAGREMLKKHPRSATVAMWIGYFLIQEKEPGEALEILLPALKEHGEAGGVYNQAFIAAMGLLRTKGQLRTKTDIAIDALMKIHDYYPFGGSAANNVALYFRDSSNPPNSRKSLEWYLKAMEREPENQDIVNDTALIYLFHMKGAEQRKCLPLFEKVLAMVHEDEQEPIRGYWDTLENLCRYYWLVDRKPELVIKYADMRYETTLGKEPYNDSQNAMLHKKLAEEALGR